MSSMDIDSAAKRTANLWRKLGTAYERLAFAYIDKAFPEAALKCGRMAEACFWQATGEGDSVSLNDCLPKSGD